MTGQEMILLWFIMIFSIIILLPCYTTGFVRWFSDKLGLNVTREKTMQEKMTQTDPIQEAQVASLMVKLKKKEQALANEKHQLRHTKLELKQSNADLEKAKMELQQSCTDFKKANMELQQVSELSKQNEILTDSNKKLATTNHHLNAAKFGLTKALKTTANSTRAELVHENYQQKTELKLAACTRTGLLKKLDKQQAHLEQYKELLEMVVLNCRSHLSKESGCVCMRSKSNDYAEMLQKFASLKNEDTE